MNIYPAIDIRGGACVRLKMGDYSKVTVYSGDPVDQARKWLDAGAEWLHIVNLDGAKSEKSGFDGILERIIKETGARVQTGGGIRALEDVRLKLEMGARRVILGTAAISDPETVRKAVAEYGDCIAVGIDARNGFAAAEGWTVQSKITALDLALRMKEIGVKTVIYTDIGKDSMMSGPNVEKTGELVRETGLNVIASGGVSRMGDLEKLAEIGGLDGAIIGKALYEGALDLQEVIKEFSWN